MQYVSMTSSSLKVEQRSDLRSDDGLAIGGVSTWHKVKGHGGIRENVELGKKRHFIWIGRTDTVERGGGWFDLWEEDDILVLQSYQFFLKLLSLIGWGIFFKTDDYDAAAARFALQLNCYVTD